MMAQHKNGSQDNIGTQNAQSLNLRLLAPTYHSRYTTVTRLLEKHGRILDLGCADGYYSRTIAASDNLVIGIDVDSRYLDKTGSSNNPRFLVADAKVIPFEDGYFDAVLSVDMLEHTADDERVTAEIRRVLKPGGQLVISVPHQNYPITYDPLNFLLKGFKRHLPVGIWGFGHRRIYSAEDLQTLLQKHGFRIEQITYLTHALAALFEGYLSTIFQGLATREKMRHNGNLSLSRAGFLYRLACNATAGLNLIDARLLSRSSSSVGIAVAARRI